MIKFFLLSATLLFNFACNLTPPPKFEPKIPDDSLSEDLPAPPKDSIIIRLKDDGSIFLEGKSVGKVEDTTQFQAELTKLLETRKTSDKSKAVIIQALSKMKYGDVKKIIEIVQSLNAEPIAMQIDKEPQ